MLVIVYVIDFNYIMTPTGVWVWLINVVYDPKS